MFTHKKTLKPFKTFAQRKENYQQQASFISMCLLHNNNFQRWSQKVTPGHDGEFFLSFGECESLSYEWFTHTSLLNKYEQFQTNFSKSRVVFSRKCFHGVCVTVAKTHLHLIITAVNAIMLVIFVSTIRNHFLSIKFKNASETLSPFRPLKVNKVKFQKKL